MKIYYAHCMAIYDTRQETRDLMLLRGLGFDVVNPNEDFTNRSCEAVREEFAALQDEGKSYPVEGQPGMFYTDAGAAVMHLIFKPMVLGCDALAFRGLSDGAVPAGVAREVEWAIEANIPVIELPSGLSRRVLTVEQTREFLREAGRR